MITKAHIQSFTFSNSGMYHEGKIKNKAKRRQCNKVDGGGGGQEKGQVESNERNSEGLTPEGIRGTEI